MSLSYFSPVSHYTRNAVFNITFYICSIYLRFQSRNKSKNKNDFITKLGGSAEDFRRWTSQHYTCCDFKQLLDEVFVISRIMKVEVVVMSRSRRLRLITLTETLIIQDITKTETNNFFYYTLNETTKKSCFCFFTDGNKTKRANLLTWPLRNHAPRSNMTCQRLTNDRIIRCIITHQFCTGNCVSLICVLFW